MKLRTLLMLTGIVGVTYGLSALLIPAVLLSVYGISPGPAEVLTIRLFGVEIFAVGLVTWFGRNVTEAGAQRAFCLGLSIAFAAGAIVSLHGTLSGVMNAVGWLAVGLFAVFALGFGYFQFVKPRT